MTRFMRHRMHLPWSRAAAAALAAACLSGCSIFSPLPLWELAKAGGTLASQALQVTPSSATRTIYHEHPPITSVCIEYGRNSTSVEVVPALQSELRRHGVESRVYDSGVQVPDCAVWLRYTASIEWGLPPFSANYSPYLDSATLALHDRDGRLLAAASYELDTVMGLGRWAQTQAKLAPLVTALLTPPANPAQANAVATLKTETLP
jgi:hypothetical protein